VPGMLTRANPSCEEQHDTLDAVVEEHQWPLRGASRDAQKT